MKPEDTKRETIVFAYDTEEQRRALLAMFPEWFNKEDGLRIVGLSHDNELKRVDLISEALGLYDDHFDRSEAIQGVLDHPNLSRFTWTRERASE